MQSAPKRILVALAVACVAFAASACVQTAQPDGTGPATTAVTSSTAEPTSTSVEAPAGSTGTIVVPAKGSALRTAILKAAGTGLGLSGDITVYQLFSQETAAIGDILPAGGTRVFFAVMGGPDAWSIAWSAPFGSSLANADALESSVPLVSPGLAARMVWNLKVAKVVAAPTLASFQAFALKSAQTYAGSTYTGSFTMTAKIAKDSTGVWWGNALATPADAGLEPIGIWGHYANGKWTGEIADFSSDTAQAGYFAPDVIAKLTLP
jgi:hypothetical protein